MIENRLQKTAVIGAAGKMGSGIALLLLQLIAKRTLKTSDDDALVLIDTSREGLKGLKDYLHTQLKKYAEKEIIQLRELCKEDKMLVSNGEIIEAFLQKAFDTCTFSTRLEDCEGAHLIFEAIVEDEAIKGTVLKKAQQFADKNCFFLTNTSSIPISVINKNAGLNGNVIGYHFYNPPAVQKLLEIIPLDDGNPELLALAETLGAMLKKTTVLSKDRAGFIGNGHFVPEIIEACRQVENLKETYSLEEAIYIIDWISKYYLLRPMGIFQLVDYVGIDVVGKIAAVMQRYHPNKDFSAPLIERLLKKGVTGGQNADGTQKNGFFSYRKNQPAALINVETGEYDPLENCDDLKQKLSLTPPKELSWKTLLHDPDKEDKIETHFSKLQQEDTLGAALAKHFLQHSKKIALQLVEDGVCAQLSDVSTVLKLGFYHLYGPDSRFIEQSETAGKSQ